MIRKIKINLFAPLLFLSYPVFAQSQEALQCQMENFQSASPIRVTQSELGIQLDWHGSDSQQLRLLIAVEAGEPVIKSLQLQAGDDQWTTLLTDSRFEYKIVEGLRRISNQQLNPLRELAVEFSDEVIERHKWDAFWDAPLDLRQQEFRGNPPPMDGVASQPGLPRSVSEVRRADISYNVKSCRVVADGARVELIFPDVSLGSFTGEFILALYEGSNLIRTEVLADTQLPSVAYKYDVGITGLDVQVAGSVSWRDTGGLMQRYQLNGPVNADQVVLQAANRLVVAETNGGAIAAFPPPHTFFWAREVEINVGNNWYRKDSNNSFSIGIRQGEQEVVERYMANWSLYSAPPGSMQQMVGYFYPTLGDRGDAFDAVMEFTNSDVYQPLDGYQVMGSHYHTNMGRELIASGSIDTRLRDFEVIKSAGINIAGPVDRPREETQLQEQHWLFEGALRHSDKDFMVLPEMENSNLLGGHWDLLFSHPVYYVDERAAGTPLITEHPEYGRMYNIGSVQDMMTMVEAENMIIYMPHPRTKGSTGYPDAVAESPQFLHDNYRGAGWRWGMGLDLSEKRLSDYRVIPLLDDMNNWIADTDLPLKSLIAITETYFKSPGDDIYANGPVTYLRLNELPIGNDYSSIINTLKAGEYFVSTGEVLIPNHSLSGSGSEALLTAQVQWTFPLDFVEVVYGDGSVTNSVVVSATDQLPFSSHRFGIPFDASGQRWVRFAAWDSAGNGAMTMPVRIP
ncbi:uncharacterized protein METZ01_LOCUS90201 [marine metagenome]|jgi:hypothetical protein|uniref:Uncharacterized protein n=1 Tax=marine metagenome TaxID=408172 RepID=A0A381VCK1_9ZZZZ|tara:strand:- start:397 stop:2613 length:2217 start_codon:yes stop_codon:yes gene_type:complete